MNNQQCRTLRFHMELPTHRTWGQPTLFHNTCQNRVAQQFCNSLVPGKKCVLHWFSNVCWTPWFYTWRYWQLWFRTLQEMYKGNINLFLLMHVCGEIVILVFTELGMAQNPTKTTAICYFFGDAFRRFWGRFGGIFGRLLGRFGGHVWEVVEGILRGS